MGSNKTRLDKENNRAAHNKLNIASHGQKKCKVCPPFKGENSKRLNKKPYGTKKPKYKTVKRKTR